VNPEMTERTKLLVEEYQEEPERVTMARTFAAAIADAVKLTPGMKCLEFGCGRGNLALLLPDGLQITAIDPAPEVIAALDRKLTGFHVTSITPQVDDIMTVTIGSPCDLIYSTLALHHIQDIDAVLRKCHATLKPSGTLILVDLDREDGTFHDDHTGIYHFGFDREWLRRRLEDNGFVVSSFREVYRREKVRADGIKKIYPLFMAVAAKRASSTAIPTH